MAVTLMPLAFAESDSAASSAASSSAGSSCEDMTDLKRVHCMNAESRMRNPADRMDSARNSRKAVIIDACASQSGEEKAECLSRIKKATMKKMEKMLEKNMRTPMMKRPMSQAAQTLCPGRRGTALALCVHNMRKTSSPLRNKSSSSSEASTESSASSSSASSAY